MITYETTQTSIDETTFGRNCPEASGACIPANLTDRNQWVVWRYEERNGKQTKVPYNPMTGLPASSTNPRTWVTFGQALTSEGFAGVGFVFAADDPFVGVDLDHCRDAETGEIEQWAQEIVDRLDSYTEVSPSGEGLHIFVRGVLPEGQRRKDKVEMYDQARYFTVTGDHVEGTPTTIVDRTSELVALHAEVFGAGEQPLIRTVARTASDQQVLRSAMAATADFGQLWAGEWAGTYPSQSEADLALCSCLAYWAGGDSEQIDRLFRQSNLYRAKWDERHSGDGRTYGQVTVQKAIESGFEPGGEVTFTDTASLADLPNTDAGNAEAVSLLYRDKLTYDAERGRWLMWAGHSWRSAREYEVFQIALATARERQKAALTVVELSKKQEAIKWAINSENEYKLRATVEVLRRLLATDEQWDSDPWLLGCQNGVVDLRTGELRDGRPQDRITKTTRLAFDPGAECSRWERFLEEVFGGDDELIGFVRRAIGYMLTGETSEQCLFLCHGNGANGKSTLLRVLRDLMSDYGANTPFSTLEVSRFGNQPTNDLAALAGARLVTASEIAEEGRLNEARIKAITGGDPVTARYLNKEFFTYTPQFKLWLAVNDLPNIGGGDDGIWRRIRLVPFNESFLGREDQSLEATLRTELPGILAWAVRGCIEWQQKGLGQPDAVKQATGQYRSDNDTLSRFIDEKCQPAPELTVTVSDFYQTYASWCVANGEACLTKAKLAKRMAARGITQGRSATERFWQGISLRHS